MSALIAEVIAIGDELTTGFRLDTNSQWLSQRLGDFGISVLYHSTVGDDFDANVAVFAVATQRADIVICTGGLGPTADDLTRQALAAAAGVDLVLDEEQLTHVKSFFAARGRKMTPSNEIQAHFPSGAMVIPNPEGTAPGIELAFNTADGDPNGCTVFALPGVPAEMKQMFAATIAERLKEMTGQTETVHHHVLRCFGSGESHIESLLPDIVKRGRDPLVGITASAGTISLRLTTKAATVDDCLEKMRPTIASIESLLGDLVFGYNGDLLETVAVDALKRHNLSIAIDDGGLHGDVAALMLKSDGHVRSIARAGETATAAQKSDVTNNARAVKRHFQSDIGLAISPVYKNGANAGDEFLIAVVDQHDEVKTETFEYRGHSATRHIIACKRVLNFLRLGL